MQGVGTWRTFWAFKTPKVCRELRFEHTLCNTKRGEVCELTSERGLRRGEEVLGVGVWGKGRDLKSLVL